LLSLWRTEHTFGWDACISPPHTARLWVRGRRSGPEAYREEERVAQYEAYCVKDKRKVQFEGEVVTLKNGRKAAKGKCPNCGTTVMRILGKADLAS
jgi:predicted RNA-binding Zn-ribbon protein involved in translation (DUF1610 family)